MLVDARTGATFERNGSLGYRHVWSEMGKQKIQAKKVYSEGLAGQQRGKAGTDHADTFFSLHNRNATTTFWQGSAIKIPSARPAGN